MKKRMQLNLRRSQYDALCKARSAIFDDTSENFALGETVKIVSKFYVMSKEASAQALVEREQAKVHQFGATEDEEYSDDEGAERGDGA